MKLEPDIVTRYGYLFSEPILATKTLRVQPWFPALFDPHKQASLVKQKTIPYAAPLDFETQVHGSGLGYVQSFS